MAKGKNTEEKTVDYEQQELTLREEYWCPNCKEGRPWFLDVVYPDEKENYTVKCLSCGAVYNMETGEILEAPKVEEKEEKDEQVQ